MTRLEILPCHDSAEIGASVRENLAILRLEAMRLGESAVEATNRGWYRDTDGNKVDISDAVQAARAGKRSIPPGEDLAGSLAQHSEITRVQVSNETTLVAARRLVVEGGKPLALNFANGITPGGGFLNGARAQEEVLCRCSALYTTLVGDPMYKAHALRPLPDSTEWVIYSPDVPVFRLDDGTPLHSPWSLSFLTCAAPYAPAFSGSEAAELLEARIHRVLDVARWAGHTQLVLGAWGCGAFGNDPARTARDFKRALEGDFAGVFSHIVFAITDWSPARRSLGPFNNVFAATR